METIYINEDIRLKFLVATSFPDGIVDAFDKLKNALPNAQSRTFYGLSKPEKNGSVVYKAAATLLKSETTNALSENIAIVTKGLYFSEIIRDWESKKNEIAEIFQKLLLHPELDPSTSCIECYQENDVLCMVRLFSN